MTIATINLMKGFHHPEAFLEYCYPGTNFPGGSEVKNLSGVQESGGMGSIPVLGRSPEEGNGNSLQYTCLENSMYRGASQATVQEVPELDMNEQLSMH